MIESELKKKADLAELYPDLIKEWDYEKNEDSPSQFTSGSNKKVWWECSICGNGWESTIYHRTDGRGCPVCARKRAKKLLSQKNLIVGETDLATTDPDIAAEWDTEKNEADDISVRDVTRKSSKKVWWRCSVCGNSYLATISNRVGTKDKRGTGCPFCSGRRAIKGKTDLQFLRPDIAAQWDYGKNDTDPSEYTVASSKRVYWICEKGHSYAAKISSRTKPDATACPYCAGKKVLKGFNDLETLRPDLLKEWDYENNEILPSQITEHSQKRVAWICEKGHRWIATLDNRANGTGCPVCANLKLLEGYNDIKTLFPNVAKDWDYERNKTRPEEHIAGTHKIAWWKCSKCGYSWQAVIKNRTYSGQGCPNCTFYFKTSVPEQAVYYYVKQYFSDAINSYKPEYFNRMEVDVFIPSLNIGIEYDGVSWHKNKRSKERDSNKSSLLKEHGVRLIRIKEESGENNFDDSYVIKSEYSSDISYLDGPINQLFQAIYELSGVKIDADIDVKRDSSKINAASQGIKRGKSLLESGVAVLSEWNYEKNGELKPDNVTPGSNKIAWWRCSKCGAEWQQQIKRKVNGGLYCPKCSKSEARRRYLLRREQERKNHQN